jgi:RNA polymerase sigma factor (TIGR02999 family)
MAGHLVALTGVAVYALRPATTRMAQGETHDVTHLLVSWREGDRHALDELIPLVYQELRRIAARARRRERAHDTLQTTALVHEAYLRLVDQRNVHWQNRAHFFAVAAQAMRRLLVDRARRRRAAKRGAGAEVVSLTEIPDLPAVARLDVLALDEALTRLAELDPRQSRIVELLCYGGLTVDETAEVLRVSERTVHREWAVAKAWLYRVMQGDR